MEAEELLELVADRLSKIAPSGFHVNAGPGGMLWYSCDEGRFPGQTGSYQVGLTGTYFLDNLLARIEELTVEEALLAVEDSIAVGAEQAISDLQDYVDEATHDPWPGKTRPPRPHAEVRNSELRMWYADGAVLVLQCEPIELYDLEALLPGLIR